MPPPPTAPSISCKPLWCCGKRPRLRPHSSRPSGEVESATANAMCIPIDNGGTVG